MAALGRPWRQWAQVWKWKILVTMGSGGATQAAAQQVAPHFLLEGCPEQEVLCGIQDMAKLLREKPCRSPASLEIMMNVVMHMTTNIVSKSGNASHTPVSTAA